MPGKQETEEIVDVAVIGSGPGGYVATIRAAQLGAKALLIEKEELGGTCLNRGCIPTKCLLADVKLYDKVKKSKVLTLDKVSVDLMKMMERKNQAVRTLVAGVNTLVKSNGIQLVRGTGEIFDKNTIKVLTPEGNQEQFKTRNIIIATGSTTASLPSVSIDGEFVISSDEALNIETVPEEIVIIGGGVIGVEFATIFNKLGSKVTIIEMLPQIIATEDDKVIQALTYLLQKDGITIFTESKVTGVSTEKEKVKVAFQDKEGKPQIVETEKVLMAIGRAPYTEGLGLEKIGIDFEGKFIKVNSKMETNVPGIYAIGDVVGNLMLAHVASAEGIVAAENIMGGNSYMEYEKVPNCIYTSPEIASVGLTEQEAREKGYKVSVGTFPYQFSGRALAIEEPEGFVKIIAKKELGEILGVHIIGENATDLIGEGLLAMELEASVEELGKIVKGHPTLSENIKEAALDCENKAINSPKKVR